MEELERQGASAGGRDRGNVLLAMALVLAALVVLVAASLVLAPTSSDGVTSESVDQRDIDVVEEGLGVVFIESNDTLDPAYEPTFEPPETEGPPPIDYDTVGALLESEPFTTEQVVQTQSLMASLAHRSMGGTIASLEPIESETRTGTLVRMGNTEAHDFGGNETVLVENATAVRDVELVFEHNTLPFTPENATTVEIGNWTLAAYQDVSASRVNYQLGGYDPEGEWLQTDEGADLHVNAHGDTINGEPVDEDALTVDPGEPPFDVVVRDMRGEETPPGLPGTHGGANLVAVGTGPDDVGNVSEEHWQEVVTRPAFNVTYIDSTTTFVDRVYRDTEYRAFEYVGENVESVLTDVTLAVETEDTDNLQNVDGNTDIWLPDYTQEEIGYEVEVLGVYSNGSTVDLTNETALTLFEATDDGFEQCMGASGEGDCAEITSEGGLVVTPTALRDPVVIEATVTPETGENMTDTDNITVSENVTVIDPYIDTHLDIAADEAAIGDDVGAGTLVLEPRKQAPHVENTTVPLDEVHELATLGPAQFVTHLRDKFGVSEDDKWIVAEAALRTAALNASEREEFLDATPDVQATMVGFDGEYQSAASDFFETYADGATFALEDVMSASKERAGAIGTLLQANTTGSPAEFERLGSIGTGVDNALDEGQLVRDTLLFDLRDRLEEIESVAQVHIDRLVELTTNVSPADTEYNDLTWSVTRFVEHLGTYDTQIQLLTEDTEYVSLFDDAVDRNDIETITTNHVLPLVEEDYSSSVIPANFATLVGEFYAATNGFTNTSYYSHNVDALAQYETYLMLGGVLDTEKQETFVDLLGELDEQTLSTSFQGLFDAAEYRILSKFELGPQGSYELWYRPALIADWDTLLEATYAGYDFRNYSATDGVTVSQLDTESIVGISVAIDYNDELQALLDNGTFSGPDMYSTYPLLTGDATPVTTTVEYDSGEMETNPEDVTYTLLGPTFSPDDPGYDGPTGPTEFASVNTTGDQPTITANVPTGKWFDDGTTPEETGPIVLEAAIGDRNAVVETSAVNLSASGFLSWGSPNGDPGTTLLLNDNPTDQAYVGVTYTLTHGNGTAAWTDTNRTTVASSDFDTVAVANESVATFDRSTMTLEAQNESAGPWPINATGIEEAAALDVPLIDQAEFRASGSYGVLCYSCGDGGTGDPYEGDPMMMLSREISTSDPYPVPTTDADGNPTWSYHNEYNAVVDEPMPVEERSSRSMSTVVKAGDSGDLYAWANYEAYMVASQNMNTLANGDVYWRNANCDEIGPCLGEPVAVVDLVGTDGTDWGSATDNGFGPSVTVSATQKAGGPGMHHWNLSYTSSTSSNVTSTVEVSGSHSEVADVGPVSMDVTVTPEESDGGNGSDDAANFTITSMDAPDNVGVGKTYNVTATIENVGGQEGEQEIVFDGAGTKTKTVTVNPGISTTVTFERLAGFEEATEYNTISTDNDSQTETTKINA